MELAVVFGYFFAISAVATFGVGTRRLEVGVASLLWFFAVAAAVYVLTGVVVPGGEALSKGFEAVLKNFGGPGAIACIGGGLTGIWMAND